MTYSIVAVDAAAEVMGIAVASHHLAAGAHVIAAEAGVGVMAVQSYAHRGYASRGMAMLRGGQEPFEIMDSLRTEDPGGAGRAQVAILTPAGQVQVHTGFTCIPEAGHAVGEGWAAQANMVRSPEVWEVMGRAVVGKGDLVDRLLDALDAAEAEGGDLRGRQSAAVTVVSTLPDRHDPVVDLRVDDHHDPLGELRRLDRMRRAGARMRTSFGVARSGNVDAAVDTLSGVQQVYGKGNLEPTVWAAVLLARAGRVDEAVALFPEGIEPGWIEFIRRLPDARMLDGPVAGALVAALEGS